MTQPGHDALVTAQFGSRADAYVASAVHAQGEDLRDLAAFVAGQDAARALDLGCGGGHVSFTIAPHVTAVVAYDLSDEMLAAVDAEARTRGLTTITTQRGPAESLAFDDETFDIVVTRFSAHHWYDMPAGIAEAYRVLKPGGIAAFIDVVAPENAALDTFLQSVELLRDASHVRDYTIAQWHTTLATAGFQITRTIPRRLHLEFSSWIARMQTPPLRTSAIRSLQESASSPIIDHFEITADNSFTLDTVAIETTKP